MNSKNISSGAILSISMVTSTALFLFLSVFTFFMINSWAGRLCIIIPAFLLLSLSVVVIIFVRRRLSFFTDVLSITIDRMISGSGELEFDEEAETLISKLQVKLNRLYEIMEMQVETNIYEKQALQSLISDISHQLKTPITNIKMYHEIMKDRDIPKEKRQLFYESIAKQMDKLDFLIDSIVKMSRLETGIIAMEPKINILVHTLADAVETIRPKAKQKDIFITLRCPEELSLRFDPKWSLEAFVNLLENAIKYNKEGGEIAITVTQWELYTKIDFTDTGIGIPEEIQGAVFKRFYRAEEVSHIEGVGIGLYLSREIIEMQSGYIEVSSVSGAGSTFSVFLPNA